MFLKITFSFMLIFSFLYIWLFKPYMDYEYKRVGDIPVTVESEYYNVTGESLCSKFYKVENGKITNLGIFPNMPIDIPDPHSFLDFKAGDRVTFTGFIYQWHSTNLITGENSQKFINMIDVISWHSGDSKNFISNETNFSPSAFTQENYISCKS